MPLNVGTRLGPYEIAAQIGVGGMGEVYRARDTKLDRVRSTGNVCRCRRIARRYLVEIPERRSSVA